MRKLKLEEKVLRKLLDELDAHDSRVGSDGTDSTAYPYRIPALRIELDTARDVTETQVFPSRKLSADGVYILVSSLVHKNCTCRVHLVTVRNSWQTVTGRVEKCRYLPGTSGVHEIFVRFDRPIDPASFAMAATRSRILAADDSAVSQKLYQHLLETMNVDLTCVSNGLEATERALSEGFDLILMDLEMPDMDGLSAVRLLRGKGYVRAIVAVSALSSEEDRQRCLAAGCDDFLPKPLTRESLAAAVQRNKSEPLVSAMLDDPGMFELIDGFVAELPNAIARLEAAFGGENLQELERTARSLKGEAAGIGFNPISDVATSLEDAAKSAADFASIRSKLTELIRLCMAARPATSCGPPPNVTSVIAATAKAEENAAANADAEQSDPEQADAQSAEGDQADE